MNKKTEYEQLHFEFEENITHKPDSIYLKKFNLTPTAIYDTYWEFAVKRQNIFWKKKNQEKYPWTDDNILSEYKFTNAYRASDRVSQYLIKNIIYTKEYKSFTPEDIFFRILLFKLFNKVETWELLEESLCVIDYKTYSYKTYDEILTKALNNGFKIYSAAYIMPSGNMYGYDKKHKNNLMMLEQMMNDKITAKIAGAKSLEDLFHILLDYPSLGKFLAFQYAIDLNYSELCDFSEMEYVVAGPGAKSGISKLFSDKGKYSDEDIIKIMSEIQEHEFERLDLNFKYLGDRKLQLIDCQNLFCETDKYTRVLYPEFKGTSDRKRIKQLYRPNIYKPIEYFYPPKWGINI